MAKAETGNKSTHMYWDCHVHVFGAPERYPLYDTSDYDPPESPLSALWGAAAPHGVARFVFVQPSVYKADHRCLFDAIRAAEDRHRGVAVLAPQASEAEIAELDALGVRGARFNCVSSAGNGLKDFPALAPRLREIGWHAHILVERDGLNEVALLQREWNVPVVLDHMGGLGPTEEDSHPAWSALRMLADSGSCWIKISGLYRKSRVPVTFTDCDRLIERLARLAPHRLLWGSDWPHTWFFHAGRGAAPEYGATLAPLVRTLGEGDLLNKILVDHPSELYR
jgi:predicted TIM-barrel fold metal-dependent hydrolase